MSAPHESNVVRRNVFTQPTIALAGVPGSVGLALVRGAVMRAILTRGVGRSELAAYAGGVLTLI